MSNADWVSLLVFAAFAFFGIVLPWLGRREGKWQRRLPPRDEAAPVPDEGLEDVLDDGWSDEADSEPVVWSPPPRPTAPVPVPRPVAAVARQTLQPRPAMPAARRVALAPPVQAPRRPAIVRSRADARRGITLMTVLGPCRAFDPY
jgi:hypothetical protein